MVHCERFRSPKNAAGGHSSGSLQSGEEQKKSPQSQCLSVETHVLGGLMPFTMYGENT